MVFLLSLFVAPCLWYLSIDVFPKLSKLCGAISILEATYAIYILN